MAEQTPGGRIHERWGRFRFSVIGQLLAATGHGSAPGAGKARPQRGCGRRWWRFLFTATPFRKMARAAFMPPVNEDALPTALLESFAGSERRARLIAALAARTWHHPTTGKPVCFGFLTIERWYYRDPVGVLRRTQRADAGQQPAMSGAVRCSIHHPQELERAIALRQSHRPRREPPRAQE